MPRKTLYILSGASVLFFALTLLFIPATFWQLHGTSVDQLGTWIGRLLPAVMLANVYLFWTLRNEPADSKGARAFSQGQVIAWGLTAVIITLMALNVGLNYMIWFTVGLAAVFTILFAIDGFNKKI